MKYTSVDNMKVILREAGVKVRPKYDYGEFIIVSSALKQVQKDYLYTKHRQLGVSRGHVLNRMILGFKPVKSELKMTLDYDAAKSTAGYLDRNIRKVFGSRDDIKFTAFTVDKHNYHKLNELAEYYQISRSAVIRLIIDYNMENV